MPVLQLSPIFDERSGRNNRATSPFVRRAISQITGHKEIRRGRERNGEKRFIIWVGQIKLGFPAGINPKPSVAILFRISRTRFGSNLKRARARTSAYSARMCLSWQT
jgi:hypothetical protein